MTFRRKIFLFTALVAVVVAAGSILVVNNRFHEYTHEEDQVRLGHASGRFDTFQATKMRSLLAQAVNIANDPRLRGVLSTGDQATIREAAEKTQLLYKMDLFWVTDVEGKVIYRVDQPQKWGDSIADLAVIRDVRNGYDSGDLWIVGNILHQVAAVPVYSGRTPIGILIVGQSFKNWINREFAQLTGMQIAFVTMDEAAESSLIEDNLQPLKEVLSEAQIRQGWTMDSLPRVPWLGRGPNNTPPAGPFIEFHFNGEPYAGSAFRLNDATNTPLATGLVFQSTKQREELLNKLQRALLYVGLVAIGFALIVSLVFANGLSRPIDELVKAAERLAQDDLDTPVPHSRGDELGVLAKEMDSMRQTLKDARTALIQSERLTTIGRMASSMTHDFRQPISTIHGFMQLMAMEGVTVEQRKNYSQLVLRQIERMQGMINELLDFARGEVRLNLQTVNLESFLQGIVENFEPEAKRKNIELRCDCGYHDTVVVDPGRIERGIDNIVRNAMQAVDRNGHLRIATQKMDNHVAILIEDDGPGIPEDLLDKLFEPFVSHGKREGTGLGLAVTKKVVEEHGGEIQVTTEQGVGTTFKLLLPVDVKQEALA